MPSAAAEFAAPEDAESPSRKAISGSGFIVHQVVDEMHAAGA
jgi:hypothetical protein